MLADIGLDISSFSLMRWASRLLPAALFALASQREERTESLQLNCDIVPLIVIRPMTGNLTRFLGLPFHVERDFGSTALHNNLNFENLLNVNVELFVTRKFDAGI